MESRVAANVARLLDLLAAHQARGTFFILGCVAERHPDVVSAIARGGHEVASHGWDHRRVTQQTPEEFRASVRRTKAALEAMTGAPRAGLSRAELLDRGRAASGRSTSSSRRATATTRASSPSGGPATATPPAAASRTGSTAPPAAWPKCRPRRCAWPASTCPRRAAPTSGSFPYGLVRAALRDCERRGVPGTFYLHPWETDPDQPRLAVPWLTRVRHYGGLRRTRSRLERLLGEFRFTSIAPDFGLGGAAAASPRQRGAARRELDGRRVRGHGRGMGRLRARRAPAGRTSISPAGVASSSGVHGHECPYLAARDESRPARRRAAPGAREEPAVRPLPRLDAVPQLRRPAGLRRRGERAGLARRRAGARATGRSCSS